MANCDQPPAPESTSCNDRLGYNTEVTVTIVCPEGSATLPVSVTVPAGTAYSLSREGAQNQAYNKALQEAQASFDARPCLFYNDEITYTAECPSTDENAGCAGGYSITVTVYAGDYVSEVSKAAANAAALAAATAQAEASLSCSFSNTQQQATATCSGSTIGDPVTVIVTAGTIVSFISQEDANARALAQATSQATNTLVCVWENEEQEYTAECSDGAVGTPVTSTALAGTHSSLVSQADANAQALAAARAQALILLDCEWESTEQSFTATCPGSIVGDGVIPTGAKVGDSVSVTIPAGDYVSTISQSDADAKAAAAAQAAAEAALVCRWTNVTQTVSLNCGEGEGGGPAVATVPVGTLFSNVSQAAVNATALATATEEATELLEELCIPACGTTLVSGGVGVDTRDIYLGPSLGLVQFSYDAFSIPDQFQLVYDGITILDTGSVSGTGSFTFAKTTSTTEITITVTGPDGTAWNYSVACPDNTETVEMMTLDIGGTPTNVGVLVGGRVSAMAALGYSFRSLTIVIDGTPTLQGVWFNTDVSNPGAPSGYTSLLMEGLFDGTTFFDGWIVYATP